jgi:hypothetical protein
MSTPPADNNATPPNPASTPANNPQNPQPNITIQYPGGLPGFMPQPQNPGVDMTAINNQLAEMQKQLAAAETARKAAEERHDSLISSQKAERTKAALATAATGRGALYADVVASLLPADIKVGEDGTPDPDALKAALDKIIADRPALFKPADQPGQQQQRPGSLGQTSALGADAGAGGAGNARPGADDLQARILEAQAKGDCKLSIALKTEQMARQAAGR